LPTLAGPGGGVVTLVTWSALLPRLNVARYINRKTGQKTGQFLIMKHSNSFAGEEEQAAVKTKNWPLSMIDCTRSMRAMPREIENNQAKLSNSRTDTFSRN